MDLFRMWKELEANANANANGGGRLWLYSRSAERAFDGVLEHLAITVDEHTEW
jgi:hypothetical protein